MQHNTLLDLLRPVKRQDALGYDASLVRGIRRATGPQLVSPSPTPSRAGSRPQTTAEPVRCTTSGSATKLLKSIHNSFPVATLPDDDEDEPVQQHGHGSFRVVASRMSGDHGAAQLKKSPRGSISPAHRRISLQDIVQTEDPDGVPSFVSLDPPRVITPRGLRRKPEHPSFVRQKTATKKPRDPLYVRLAAEYKKLEDSVFTRERQGSDVKKKQHEMRVEFRMARQRFEDDELRFRSWMKREERNLRKDFAEEEVEERRGIEAHDAVRQQGKQVSELLMERQRLQRIWEEAAYEKFLQFRDKYEKTEEMERARIERQDQGFRARYRQIEQEQATRAKRREHLRRQMETEAQQEEERKQRMRKKLDEEGKRSRRASIQHNNVDTPSSTLSTGRKDRTPRDRPVKSAAEPTTPQESTPVAAASPAPAKEPSATTTERMGRPEPLMEEDIGHLATETLSLPASSPETRTSSRLYAGTPMCEHMSSVYCPSPPANTPQQPVNDVAALELSFLPAATMLHSTGHDIVVFPSFFVSLSSVESHSWLDPLTAAGGGVHLSMVAHCAHYSRSAPRAKTDALAALVQDGGADVPDLLLLLEAAAGPTSMDAPSELLLEGEVTMEVEGICAGDELRLDVTDDAVAVSRRDSTSVRLVVKNLCSVQDLCAMVRSAVLHVSDYRAAGKRSVRLVMSLPRAGPTVWAILSRVVQVEAPLFIPSNEPLSADKSGYVTLMPTVQMNRQPCVPLGGLVVRCVGSLVPGRLAKIWRVSDAHGVEWKVNDVTSDEDLRIGDLFIRDTDGDSPHEACIGRCTESRDLLEIKLNSDCGDWQLLQRILQSLECYIDVVEPSVASIQLSVAAEKSTTNRFETKHCIEVSRTPVEQDLTVMSPLLLMKDAIVRTCQGSNGSYCYILKEGSLKAHNGNCPKGSTITASLVSNDARCRLCVRTVRPLQLVHGSFISVVGQEGIAFEVLSASGEKVSLRAVVPVEWSTVAAVMQQFAFTTVDATPGISTVVFDVSPTPTLSVFTTTAGVILGEYICRPLPEPRYVQKDCITSLSSLLDIKTPLDCNGNGVVDNCTVELQLPGGAFKVQSSADAPVAVHQDRVVLRRSARQVATVTKGMDTLCVRMLEGLGSTVSTMLAILRSVKVIVETEGLHHLSTSVSQPGGFHDAFETPLCSYVDRQPPVVHLQTTLAYRQGSEGTHNVISVCPHAVLLVPNSAVPSCDITLELVSGGDGDLGEDHISFEVNCPELGLTTDHADHLLLRFNTAIGRFSATNNKVSLSVTEGPVTAPVLRALLEAFTFHNDSVRMRQGARVVTVRVDLGGDGVVSERISLSAFPSVLTIPAYGTQVDVRAEVESLPSIASRISVADDIQPGFIKVLSVELPDTWGYVGDRLQLPSDVQCADGKIVVAGTELGTIISMSAVRWSILVHDNATAKALQQFLRGIGYTPCVPYTDEPRLAVYTAVTAQGATAACSVAITTRIANAPVSLQLDSKSIPFVVGGDRGRSALLAPTGTVSGKDSDFDNGAVLRVEFMQQVFQHDSIELHTNAALELSGGSNAVLVNGSEVGAVTRQTPHKLVISILKDHVDAIGAIIRAVAYRSTAVRERQETKKVQFSLRAKSGGSWVREAVVVVVSNAVAECCRMPPVLFDRPCPITNPLPLLQSSALQLADADFQGTVVTLSFVSPHDTGAAVPSSATVWPPSRSAPPLDTVTGEFELHIASGHGIKLQKDGSIQIGRNTVCVCEPRNFSASSLVLRCADSSVTRSELLAVMRSIMVSLPAVAYRAPFRTAVDLCIQHPQLGGALLRVDVAADTHMQ